MTIERRDDVSQQTWRVVARPGFIGKRKDALYAKWDREYGPGRWKIAWELGNGEVLDYGGVFWKIYVAGYVRHFLQHPEEAAYLTENFAFAYDKDEITREEAFDPFAIYEKPGRPNQFHNVALNIALEMFLGMTFCGPQPIQVREGKPGTPLEQQPAGYLWSPGRIATVRPDLLPAHPLPEGAWWSEGTIEDVYQRSKVVLVKG